MRFLSLASVAMLVGIGVAGSLATSVSSRTLTEAANPAETPPATYTGRQYVDSAGCVYVRAGFEGNVKWVPRVTRQRQVVCGQTPTFGNASRQAVAAAAPRPQAAPVTRPAATPRPTQVRRVAQAPRLPAAPDFRVVAGPVAAVPTASGPLPAATAIRPAAAPTAARAVSKPQSSCGAYFNAGARCQPQAQDPSSGIRVISGTTRVADAQGGGAISIRSTSGQTRLVPVAPPIPEGYQPVWQDGRLNPLRGVPEGTAAARRAVAQATTSNVRIAGAPLINRDVPTTAHGYDLAWTRSEPYLLFDRRTGIVVGDQFPQLTYPNLTVQTAASAPTAGTVRLSTKSPGPRPGFAATAAPTPAIAGSAAPVATVGHRYIQVATYARPDQAQNSAQRLANAGLPTRIGTYSSGGQKRQVIVLGPFGSAHSVQSALSTAKRFGFTQAFSRR